MNEIINTNVTPLMSTKEVADVLNVDPKTVQRTASKLFSSNIIEYVSNGGRPTMMFNENQVTAIKLELQNHSKVNANTPMTELEEDLLIQQGWMILQNRVKSQKEKEGCMKNPSPSPKENKKYYTYIAKDLKNKNLYKIGATSDLDGREKSLRVSNPFIDIIASKQTEKGFNFKLEAALHKYFKDYNVAREWFELNQDQVDEIIDLFEFTSCTEHED